MLIWLVASVAVSLAGTGLLIRVLRVIRMLDLPGQRRLHAEPVLRGGGLTILITVPSLVALGSGLADASMAMALAGLMIAGGIGWLDDRRSLGIGTRLLAHAAAGLAMWWGLTSLQPPADWPISPFALASAALILSVIASINLHNFIDGANGMLAWQTVFVLLVLLATGSSADTELNWVTIICLGAVLGFLPWNFPRAKVFLGDVGSGALGYLLALLTWWAMLRGQLSLPEALVLHSLVLIDTLCTLFSRMAGGRRWWRAHREHLYQWLIRSGRSHARVVLALQLWNLLIVLPAMLLIRWLAPPLTEPVGPVDGLQRFLPWLIVAGVALLGTSAWRWSKRGILRRHRAK
jgi:UDP-N-acetylmuramyl pentapeptide phosphotransferase/UDP-N-acetylglucosamine-1-phosphate transferase